jgi:hypothetical protein
MVRFEPQPLIPGKGVPGTHWIGGWVGSGASLNIVEKADIFFSSQELNPASFIF